MGDLLTRAFQYFLKKLAIQFHLCYLAGHYAIANVAQSVEQLTRNEQVVRSIRIVGSMIIKHLRLHRKT